MQLSRSGRGLRTALAATACLFGLGGATTVVGLAGTAGAQAAPPQHYLCYTASAKKGFTVPPGIRLVNAFAPNGFVPTVGPANLHCNPAVKVVPGASYAITEPDWHFLAFKLKAQQPSNTVTVTNQFGTGNLITSSPNELFVPSWKSLSGPPNQNPNTPPGEDHYTCYPTKLVKGSKFTPPSSVQVQDEFSPGALTNVTVGKPQELCVPTEKILPTGQVFPINDPSLNYLCFKVSKTPTISPVFDENQFGTGTVTIKATKWLCLPSTIGQTGT
jgi:hypothetical protein